MGFRNLGIHAEGHPTAFGLIDFKPNRDTWVSLNDLITDLEIDHQATITIVESTNLALTMTQKGMDMANKNCYVRDMYRTYIKYVGKNAMITRTTYKTMEYTYEDKVQGIMPDITVRGVSYKYVRDENGLPVPKYIEYVIDGRKVKSFGASLENGYILPILERGYIQLYLQNKID